MFDWLIDSSASANMRVLLLLLRCILVVGRDFSSQSFMA